LHQLAKARLKITFFFLSKAIDTQGQRI